MGTVQENKEREYICGRCGEIVDYLIDDERPDCPVCEWTHGEKDYRDTPQPRFEL
jgi:rubrerythrin